MSTPWGVYDTKDGCWLGDEHGPKLFTDTSTPNGQMVTGRDLARCAATIAGERMRPQWLRFRARAYYEQRTRLKDVVTPRHSAEEALRRIEGTS